jgi:hypothetical protein
MKSVLILILLSFIRPAANSQTITPHSIDSLKEIIRQHKDDSTKVKLLASYSFYIVFTSPEQALSFAQEGLLLSKSINYPKGQVLSNSSIGFTKWLTGDHAEATEIFIRSP